MLGDDRVGRRLVPPQSISGHAIRDRLHLVRSEALELRRVRRQKLSCVVASCFIAQGTTQTLLARNVGQGGGGAKLGLRALGKQMVGRRLSQIEAKGLLAKFDRHYSLSWLDSGDLDTH